MYYNFPDDDKKWHNFFAMQMNQWNKLVHDRMDALEGSNEYIEECVSFASDDETTDSPTNDMISLLKHEVDCEVQHYIDGLHGAIDLKVSDYNIEISEHDESSDDDYKPYTYVHKYVSYKRKRTLDEIRDIAKREYSYDATTWIRKQLSVSVDESQMYIFFKDSLVFVVKIPNMVDFNRAVEKRKTRQGYISVNQQLSILNDMHSKS